jgi:glycosyltransferase involved in cell wall biosynthesis
VNILFLTDNFPPESNAPATRTYEHALEWVRAGHRVSVITTAPNFPEGRLMDGYRNAWWAEECMDGIRVIRVKSYIAANEGFLKRSLDYTSFMLSGAFAALLHARPDVVVTTSPQFFCAMAGWIVSRLRRLPWVFELRDLWPASIVAVGAMKKSKLIHLLESIELRMYHDANVVVSVTPAFKADLVCRGVDPAKIHVVLNGVDLSRYRPLPKDQTLLRRLEIQGKFVVGYLGTHGMAHTLDKVVDAATLLRDRPRIVFLFVGAGAKRAELEETVKARNLTNVRLLPSQSKALMPALWSVVDVALVPLRNHPLFATVIPSKIFEAMGTGTPVLLSAPEGDAADLVRAAGCGVHVRPEDAPVMAKAIAALEAGREECIALGAAGVAAAPQYSRPKQAALMLSVIEAAAGKSTPAGLIEPTR